MYIALSKLIKVVGAVADHESAVGFPIKVGLPSSSAVDNIVRHAGFIWFHQNILDLPKKVQQVDARSLSLN